MAKVSVVVLGVGSVGRAFLARLARWAPSCHAELALVALADSSAVLFAPSGLPRELWPAIVDHKAAGKPLSSWPGAQPVAELGQLIGKLQPPFVVVDLTASQESLPLLLAACERGAGLVLANKRPLCARYEAWHALNANGLLRYEATVGAGLPVIRLLQYLQAAGETIRRVEAALSGTLGYIFSRVDEGLAFSAAVREAHRAGYTEPDPRDDLGGMDVARKALIIARTLGLGLELADIAVEALYPLRMGSLSVPEFLSAAAELDSTIGRKAALVHGSGRRLRYLATITPEGATVGLREVEPSSPFAALSGPDNLVLVEAGSFPTPIRLAGPGAGPEVTAAAILADLLDLACALQSHS
jgi:homoserine dehydrogenase